MGKEVHSVHDHAASINDLQFNKDGTHFVSASKDCTAKLFDTDTLECLKTYKTERPVNSAALSPIMDHVSVTLSALRHAVLYLVRLRLHHYYLIICRLCWVVVKKLWKSQPHPRVSESSMHVSSI